MTQRHSYYWRDGDAYRLGSIVLIDGSSHGGESSECIVKTWPRSECLVKTWPRGEIVFVESTKLMPYPSEPIEEPK